MTLLEELLYIGVVGWLRSMLWLRMHVVVVETEEKIGRFSQSYMIVITRFA